MTTSTQQYVSKQGTQQHSIMSIKDNGESFVTVLTSSKAHVTQRTTDDSLAQQEVHWNSQKMDPHQGRKDHDRKKSKHNLSKNRQGGAEDYPAVQFSP